MNDGVEPEFGLRLLGYSRREVDEFVTQVRRELRDLDPSSPDLCGEVRIIPSASVPAHDPAAEQAGPAGSTVVRLIGFAQEEAERRLGAATAEAEQTLRGARELADRILGEARQRAAELEARVADTLERELTARVGELTRTHARMVTGLSGMRESLDRLLEADAELGALDAPAFQDLVPQQRDLIAQAPPLSWPEQQARQAAGRS